MCRDILLKVGQESLAKAKAQTPDLAPVQLRIPQLVFETEMLLRLGEKTIHLIHAPGHSPDGVIVHVREDKVLAASDAVTPVPLVVRGDTAELVESLRLIKSLSLENIIQGHGGVLLRGEVDETIDSSVDYLQAIEKQCAGHRRQGSRPIRFEGHRHRIVRQVTHSAGWPCAAAPPGQPGLSVQCHDRPA